MHALRSRLPGAPVRLLAAAASSVSILFSGGAAVAAQETGSIVGVVVDSTVSAPLAGAVVAVLGTDVEATTDSLGRFTLGEVPAGAHQVTVFHVRLQVLGASLPLANAEVRAGATARLRLAVPSRETLLRAWCGSETRSTGGVVRDLLTQNPVSGVAVLLHRSRRRGPPEVVETDDFGEFRFCSGPTDEEVGLQAVWGDVSGRLITLPAGTGPLPQDLYIAVTEPVTLVATLRDVGSGSAVPDASVSVEGSQVGGVTDEDGAIRLRGIPAGLVVVRTEHLAFGARVDTLFAESGETLQVELSLQQDAIELEPIVVTSRTSPQEEAVRTGFRFDGMTRAMVDAVIHRTPTFAALLRAANVPGLRVAETMDGQLCVETLRRGGADCSMVEVILNGVLIPEAGRTLGLLDPATIDRFQFVPPIEARTRFQGGNVGHGVLLVYTR